jgi:radical SAM superfamily enzyme YgiQ (UPF0313 family)
MTDIVLATLNARWSHASLGLRYLYANLGDLQSRARIEEFTIATPLDRVVERLLEGKPRLIGLGVYIWNVERTTELIARLRETAPEIRIVIGGPEVSHEVQEQAIVQMADHVITGPADLSFAVLARQLLEGPRPLMKVIAGVQPELDSLVLPYEHYSDIDIAHRNLYVEASRGCPYKCEFCLSALDKTAWPFELDRILEQLAQLHRRGARRFRFVDRTFNLKAQTGRAILEFSCSASSSILAIRSSPILNSSPTICLRRCARRSCVSRRVRCSSRSVSRPGIRRFRRASADARTMPAPRAICAGCASTARPICMSI